MSRLDWRGDFRLGSPVDARRDLRLANRLLSESGVSETGRFLRPAASSS